MSGEPVSPQIALSYGTKAKEQADATKIAQINVVKRAYQKEYMEYWNSTKDLTGTGRPVDAVIAPVAPFPAARPEKFIYYGYSTFVNIVDYSSCVVPVTIVDKAVDTVNKDFKALSDYDALVQQSCKSFTAT